MKLASKTVQVMSAALLLLAVSQIWPSAAPLAPSSHAQVHGVATEVSHNHSAQHDHRHNGAIHIDCEAAGIGCCMMTLCHSALAIEPNHLAIRDMGGRTEPAMTAFAFGTKPDVVDPPPRVSAV